MRASQEDLCSSGSNRSKVNTARIARTLRRKQLSRRSSLHAGARLLTDGDFQAGLRQGSSASVRRLIMIDAAPARFAMRFLDDAEQECRDDHPDPQQNCHISERGLVGNEAALDLLAALHCLRVATEQVLGKQRVAEQKAE